jgi:WD40 repeat protein
MGQYKYYAFISYKREDESWAKWLQHKLEYYKLPTEIRREKTDLKDGIRPIFKDTTDLKPGLLAENIQNALAASQYLIVICSPRAANSVWVSKEVQSFIDSGRSDKIIPFIISGEPNATNPENECFPEGLRQLVGTQEILGANINEMGRNAAAIKVIARMFDVQFDTLWQRYKKASRRTNILIFSGIIIFLLIALATAMTLWSKNKTITQQNERLNELVTNLEEENKTYSQMRNQKERYSFVGTLRGNEFDNQLVVGFHPYDPIIVFADDWGYWIHNIRSNTEFLLPTNNAEAPTNQVEQICFSKDGSEVLGASTDYIFIWNVNTHQLTKHSIAYSLTNTEDSILHKQFPEYDRDISLNHTSLDSICKIQSTTFRYDRGKLYATYNGHTSCTNLEKEYYIQLICNSKYNEALFVGLNRAALYDLDTNTFTQFFKGYKNEDFSFSQNGEYLLIGKDIFERNIAIDTIHCAPSCITKVENIPSIKSHKDTLQPYIVDNMDTSCIKYTLHGKINKIDVLRMYTMGNAQGSIDTAIFVKPNKIVAVLNQDNHRVYNIYTHELLGTLVNPVWTNFGDACGNELTLAHYNSGLAYSKHINGDLYVVSSGGIIRIYDLSKFCIKTIIELPIPEENYIRECFITDDGSTIYYQSGDDTNVANFKCSIAH